MNAENFFDLQVLFHREREPRVMGPRMDPMATMSEREFKGHFRFRREYGTFTVNSTLKESQVAKLQHFLADFNFLKF